MICRWVLFLLFADYFPSLLHLVTLHDGLNFSLASFLLFFFLPCLCFSFCAPLSFGSEVGLHRIFWKEVLLCQSQLRLVPSAGRVCRTLVHSHRACAILKVRTSQAKTKEVRGLLCFDTLLPPPMRSFSSLGSISTLLREPGQRLRESCNGLDVSTSHRPVRHRQAIFAPHRPSSVHPRRGNLQLLAAMPAFELLAGLLRARTPLCCFFFGLCFIAL
mmetsp:Transcript_22102/g.39658  ORF Transcript_22102/g.39658 Transcript_22102/m.39658 type:complete len:217 (+) Transcript_22102:1124-1774(+)